MYVNDTPDVEMTETSTVVFGLNDKIWCAFWLSQFTRRAFCWDVHFFIFLQWSLVLTRSRTSNGTKKLSVTLSFFMTINIFYNLSSKLTTTRLASMISSRVKDTVSSLTFLVPLVLVSDFHIKRQLFLVELISSFSSSLRENFFSRSYEWICS